MCQVQHSMYKTFGKLGRAPCALRETSASEIKEQVIYLRQIDVPGSSFGGAASNNGPDIHKIIGTR